MATGRTLFQHTRYYAGGYDLSGVARAFGPLTWEYQEIDMTCPLGDAVKGYYPGDATITAGEFRGALMPDTGGIYDLVTGGNTSRVVLQPIGIRAAPAAGDPAWCGQFLQRGFRAQNDSGMIVASLPFSGWDAAALAAYSKPWGVLLHAKAAETAVNTGTGIDDRGAATSAGGYFVYQLFSSNGTVTLKIQDAATNSNASFTDLSGATSGAINAATTPAAGLVALATTATVRRYLRWQLVLGTATTATFALAFVRI